MSKYMLRNKVSEDLQTFESAKEYWSYNISCDISDYLGNTYEEKRKKWFKDLEKEKKVRHTENILELCDVLNEADIYGCGSSFEVVKVEYEKI